MMRRGNGRPPQRDEEAELAELAEQEVSLIDALRAWHRYQHGDEVGALEDIENGAEITPELESMFAEAMRLSGAFQNLCEVADEVGHDSEDYDDAAAAYLSALGRFYESAKALVPDEDQADAPRGPGAPRQGPPRPGAPRPAAPPRQGAPQAQGADPAKVAAARKAAAAASMAGMMGGGLSNSSMAGGMPNPGEVLPPAGSPMDLGRVAGMPPPIAGGGASAGAPGWGTVGSKG